VEAHLQLGAIERHVAATAFDKLTKATSIGQVLMIEAHAAKSAWAARNIIMQWREAGSLPQSWKLPYSTRRRMTGKTPKNATDPINTLLNLALAVTIGRLTVAIAARGLSPAIGFMHKSPRWSLSYDAIEPLRPHIEDAVFTFIDKHQFSPKDFIVVNDGSVKTANELARAVIERGSVGNSGIDSIVDWLCSLFT
jgi:CRISP-associated protein Cas1